jgi:hypothetical protein
MSRLAAASATVPLAPGACRITDGSNDSYFPNLVVASIRRCLATIFSIPDDAQAFVVGSAVDEDYRLRAGDSVQVSGEYVPTLTWGSPAP